ncbi:MAG: signal peptidase I [Candidatus Altimarinota bacterium]
MGNNQNENKGKILNAIEGKLDNSNLNRDQKKHLLATADLVLNLIIVVFFVFIVRTFLMSPFQVYGISMCNTLNYQDGKCHDAFGDYIIINKSSYLNVLGWKAGTPQRGDIVVFRPPQNNNEFYIKRVIGLPGDTIKLIDGNVYLFNNENPQGIKLDEPYLNEENLGHTFATGGISEFTVPENQYFVLGDNRERSSDSRLCFKESPGSPGCETNGITPFLPAANIEGKAALVLWPQPRIITTHQYQELE